MIIKIKPVSGPEVFPGEKEVVFETDSYEVHRERYKNRQEFCDRPMVSGAREVEGFQHPESCDFPVTEITCLNQFNGFGQGIFRLIGQATVFVMNGQGHTIDRFDN